MERKFSEMMDCGRRIMCRLTGAPLFATLTISPLSEFLDTKLRLSAPGYQEYITCSYWFTISYGCGMETFRKLLTD